MSRPEPIIKNLEEIIGQRLSSNEFITKTEILNLLEPGENYWSDMMKIHVNVKNRVTEAEKEIHAVAKCVADMPGGDEAMKEAMKDLPVFMFKKEMLFYKQVVPTIQTFLKSRGMSPVEYFPEYYGGRLSLAGDSNPDKEAVLLLENLQTSGYQNMDRHEGFDFDGAKTVIKDLAHLHAVIVAMKQLEPTLFNEKIKKLCEDRLPPPPPPPADGDKPNGPMGFTNEVFTEILEEEEECKPAIPIYLNLLEEQKKKGFEEMFNEKPREPFSTLVHQDMWMNNTMQQLDSKGRPIKNKFVDFQMYSYGNPAKDFQFFLLTSVQLSVLKTRFDYLMKFYHDHFTKLLSDLGCDVAPFSYENFLEEVKSVMPDLLTHGSFMLIVIIYGKKGTAVDPTQVHTMTKQDLDPRALAKFRFIVKEAYKRGWIQ